MGKAKQKRHKVPKPQPTGLPSVQDFDNEEAANGSMETSTSASQTVSTVIDKLTSPSVEEREYACTALSSCVNQPGAIPEFLKLDGVRVLSPLIVDPSNAIRQAALGALRNISVDGGPDVCKKVVLKDVLTPLVTLFTQYGVAWVPEHNQSKGKPDSRVEIFIQAVHLLTNLCESTELAVAVFNREALSQYLLPCLNFDLYGYPLSIAAAQCLYSVSEENPELSVCLNQVDNQTLLERLASLTPQDCGQLLLRTLALGILYNCNSNVIANATGDVIVSMVTKLTETISQNSSEKLQDIFKKIPDSKPSNDEQVNGGGDTNDRAEKKQDDMVTDGVAGEAMEEESDKITQSGPSDKESNKITQSGLAEMVSNKMTQSGPVDKGINIDQELQEVHFLLTAQQVALEILTNLCVAEDGSVWEDMDSSSSSSDDISMETNVDEQEVGVDNMGSALSLPTEIHSAFKSVDLLNKVLCQTHMNLPENVAAKLKEYHHNEGLKKSMKIVESHALLCINNLVTCLELETLGGDENLYQIWLTLVQMLSSLQDKSNSSMLEAVTSALRAIIQKLASADTNKFSEVKVADLGFIIPLSKSCELAQVRVNAIRILSTIGCILGNLSPKHPCLKVIGLFLVDVSCHDNDLWVTAESLDSIFDVFGEDHLDPLVKEIGLVEKLQTLLPQLKTKMSSQRKHLGSHYPVISTAKTNLIRFIKYKTSSEKI